ncbi:hypothetical protein [Kineosporia sp. R_H_3]|uniref:hypothetical protein n=1 Tax=Kineosporia sp. R_H_3 TaxID=1961848 RepID=UPI0013043F66|nr:hypothetical protein [Kineosporia sp. R_H_3]MBI4943606.1 hypothetical protein [Actinomycetota bacterium]
MAEPAAVPFAPTDDDPAQRHRRDLLAALLVERFTPYQPPPAADRSRKGAA